MGAYNANNKFFETNNISSKFLRQTIFLLSASRSFKCLDVTFSLRNNFIIFGKDSILINLYYRKIITRGQIYDMFDLFTSKANNYNVDSVIKVVDTNINRFDGKGFGIKYLLECLKVDNVRYYKHITKKDMIIDNANDDIGACELVANYYKKSFIICKGVLYVHDNNIWICGGKQGGKLLIDMIGRLDIMFNGADGKRQYYYNTSIKHVKDCIVCILANKTIINYNFYDNMIKNNIIICLSMIVSIHSKTKNYILMMNFLIFILLYLLKLPQI
jgi:hypothetical protein